jgi:hypothetical protein
MANASIDIAGNMTQVVAGQPGAAAYSGVEATTVIALLIPLAILIYILHWGSKKAKRKDTALEVSYNLVALEIIMLVLSPLCSHNMCLFGAAIPVIMLIALMLFVYHRKCRDREYAADIAKAVSEGHVRPDSIIHKKFQEEMDKVHRKPIHHKIKHHVKKKVEELKARARKAGLKKERATPEAAQLTPARKHWLAKYAEGMKPESPKPPEEPKEVPEPEEKQEIPASKQFTTPKWLTRSLEEAPHRAPHESWSYRPPTDRPKRTGPREAEKEAVDHIIRKVFDKRPGEPGQGSGV